MLNRYLIESPHDADKCDWIMREMLHLGYLYHFDWGCKSDVHTGWGVVEAESEAQAGLVIPQLVRPQACARARSRSATRWRARCTSAARRSF
jgi:hypothetical protein